MQKFAKAAVIAAMLAGFQITGAASAFAGERTAGSQTGGLLQYAEEPATRPAEHFKPFKVASKRSRRRNRAIVGGVIAAGIAALILSEAARSRRDRYYYDDDNRYYRYPGRRTCRVWARRCDNGRYRYCRKWDRRCR